MIATPAEERPAMVDLSPKASVMKDLDDGSLTLECSFLPLAFPARSYSTLCTAHFALQSSSTLTDPFSSLVAMQPLPPLPHLQHRAKPSRQPLQARTRQQNEGGSEKRQQSESQRRHRAQILIPARRSSSIMAKSSKRVKLDATSMRYGSRGRSIDFSCDRTALPISTSFERWYRRGVTRRPRCCSMRWRRGRI